ncbi:hypothetical protein Asulf_00396 [Archaeoglobus sulfaticallidus PM70-1]|uniref:Uncharacterized protein n=1 Tax=Archaeoglobus sulfaticallidus PM70-1 TaxID=387631 RepID=N0BBN9_9EURY|nr:hypothetical protein [Archaeoglobus sulfaticallidus]AGK60423.1 hypothetical protein Asulf_00396 [Archaeoglobus sulfaticallidus PM70-1]
MLVNINNKVTSLIKSLVDWEALADFMEPLDTVNIFEPINEPTLEHLERMYLRDPNGIYNPV